MRALYSIVVLLIAGCFESAAQPGVCVLGTRRDCTCDDGGPGWETCYLESPAVWGPCTCNMQPVAVAGMDRTVSYKTQVMLDGSLSVDDDGPDRIYEWTMDARPPGSQAMLDDPTSVHPSFFADVAGQYRLSLTVGDGLKTSAVASVNVIAKNDSPTAMVGSGGKLHAGTTFQLDGSMSFDPNGDTLTYQWAVTQRPPGSVAVPASPSSALTQFVPDVRGLYTITLTVNDGNSASSAAPVSLDVYYPFAMIPSFIRDAAYSRALDRVVVVGPPNVFYVYDFATGTSQSVTLAADPLAVSISPDGLTAVVGHASAISVISLQSPSVTLFKTISGSTNDIIHGGNGYAYVFPTLASRAIENVPLSGAAVVAGPDTIALRAALVPGAQAIYAESDTLDVMYRFDLVNGITSQTRAVVTTDCGGIWMSDDGQHIFRGCNTIYSASSVAASDMVAEGSLVGASFITDLSQSTSAGKVIALAGDVRIYGYPSLTFEKSFALPRMLIDGADSQGVGRFVFLRADNTTFAVIEEANTGTGSRAGIGTFPL
jgi:hypothetical protein